ncbi:hypothetical protein IG631_20360 [Alternaria alternata]|jgi:hypothetical protein|nr:hypothetical protein IG631_20360 [Alternaria alternata]
MNYVHDQSYSMTTLYHEQDMVNVEERKLREDTPGKGLKRGRSEGFTRLMSA